MDAPRRNGCAFACIVGAISTMICPLPVMISTTICALLLADFCISTTIYIVMFCISSWFGTREPFAELLRFHGHDSSRCQRQFS